MKEEHIRVLSVFEVNIWCFEGGCRRLTEMVEACCCVKTMWNKKQFRRQNWRGKGTWKAWNRGTSLKFKMFKVKLSLQQQAVEVHTFSRQSAHIGRCGVSLTRRLPFTPPPPRKTSLKQTNKQTPWSESASELYKPSDRRFSAKWLPTFADKGCHVVSVTDP
jgi:hypothetical protein